MCAEGHLGLLGHICPGGMGMGEGEFVLKGGGNICTLYTRLCIAYS